MLGIKLGMLNNVCIFEASVFNLRLDSNFTNSKLDSHNFSQGDSQGANFTARSYDLVLPGIAPPLVGGLSARLFCVYLAVDMSLCQGLLSRRSFTKLPR